MAESTKTPKEVLPSIKSSKFIHQQNGWLTTKRNTDKFSTDCLLPTYMQNFLSINNLMGQIGNRRKIEMLCFEQR